MRWILGVVLVVVVCGGAFAQGAEYVLLEETEYYSGPGGEVLGVLEAGRRVTVTGVLGEWRQFLAGDGRYAYVEARLLAPAATGEAQRPPDGEKYAALALSVSTARYGAGSNFSSREGAEQEALGNCDQPDCALVEWVKNGCISLAVNASGEFFTASAPTLDAAVNDSMEECGKTGQECVNSKTLCND